MTEDEGTGGKSFLASASYDGRWLFWISARNGVLFAFGLAIFAGVANIMVYISLDELLPTAKKYEDHPIAIYGLISGMVVMAICLVLFV